MAWNTSAERRWYYRANKTRENTMRAARLRWWSSRTLGQLRSMLAEHVLAGTKPPRILMERLRIETAKAERAASQAAREIEEREEMAA
jgi:hypothetical protein